MRYSISNTAEYGDLTRGKRVIGEPTREAMKKILGEIQSGDFAREWIAENKAGQENFQRMRAEQQNHQIEREGKELRSMMDWIDRSSDGQPLPQAIPDDRGPDAAAAGGVAGDGRADALPPRAGVRRGLRARARPAQAGVRDRERGPGVRRLGQRRDGVGGRQPGTPRRARAGRQLREVRRALGRALRRLRRPHDPLGDRVGPQGRPGRARPPPGRARGRRGGLHHALRDLDGRGQRRQGADRGSPPPRRADRRGRRLRDGRGAAAAGRVGRRRGGRRLAEGADGAARPRLRERERRGAGARRRGAGPALLLRLGAHGQRAAQGPAGQSRSPRPSA